ncbi:MAG: glycosyltransferase family 2 protein [Bryobacteraceae bacterium]|nr:glycosyltransferase family 2 protein [Bryobacteraceae bacterium]
MIPESLAALDPPAESIPYPAVSVIIPCRNEVGTISGLLDSILNNGYAGRLEVVVADGLSDDGTADLLRRAAEADARVRVIANPERLTPCGLNRAISAASGEILLRVDGHSRLKPGYIQTAVQALLSTGADNVGGVLETRPRQAGVWAATIATAIQLPFGVGNSAFRTGKTRPAWVDTVFGGCWRKTFLEQIGGFNEKLARGQDLELNQRIRAIGGRVLLLPELVCEYYPPASLKSFIHHSYRNGEWAIRPILLSQVFPVRVRHLTPLLAILTGLGLLILGVWLTWLPLLCVFMFYVLACAWVASRAPASVATRLRLPVAFVALHASYGVGSLIALVRIACSRMKRAVRKA